MVKKYAKRTKRKWVRLSKKQNIYSNAYAEKLSKKLTQLVPIFMSPDGRTYTMGGADFFNIGALLATSSFFLNTVLSNNKPNYQRIRLSGMTLEYCPYLLDGNGSLALAPLVFAVFPDYISGNDVPDTFASVDQKDRFLVLPISTTKPMRKYWAFPRNAMSFGAGTSGYPLGSYFDVAEFVRQYGAGAASYYPGIVTIAGLDASNVAGNRLVATLVVDLYIDLDKPTR